MYIYIYMELIYFPNFLNLIDLVFFLKLYMFFFFFKYINIFYYFFHTINLIIKSYIYYKNFII